MAEVKKWYQSRILWANILALIAMIVQSRYGFVIALEEQVAILTIANLVLRASGNGGLDFGEFNLNEYLKNLVKK